jgi:two-component system, cell cycle sensor histidine kinase and response regulator CckA
VEDDPTLGRVLGLVLISAGYAVTISRDGADALKRFRESPGAVHVVLSDVTMPRLSGFQLASALHEIQPALPVILMTGHCNMATSQQARAFGVAAVLGKPVDIDDLLATVDSVFEQARLEA